MTSTNETEVKTNIIIHVRLRNGIDGDIATWYESQVDKSQTVRDALLAYIRLQNGDSQEAVVRKAVARELACLPDILAVTVREALAAYQFTPTVQREGEPGAEDPELAARLDAGLEMFED